MFFAPTLLGQLFDISHRVVPAVVWLTGPKIALAKNAVLITNPNVWWHVGNGGGLIAFHVGLAPDVN